MNNRKQNKKPKTKIYTNCFLSFGKTLNESTLIYKYKVRTLLMSMHQQG